ncbi:YslB family protein [Bacillus massiliglaciei]|uniref:YslB family protein n=1 Tax=Bacillus massiliglaciei TaxID=1816693 RepID=UPI000B1F6E0C|nr:YslB family protein [Bacillus massiliglaciei]
MKKQLSPILEEAETQIENENESIPTENEQESRTDQEPQMPVFGYELIREVLLNDLLGKDSPHLLYWAGKKLARQFPLSQFQDIIIFFRSAGWGHLEILKESKTEIELSLSGEYPARRLSLHADCNFQLEAGFLAEQCTLLKKCRSEATEEIKGRAKKVLFTVQWDPKDPV